MSLDPWLAQAIDGAPERLRARVESWVSRAIGENSLPARLGLAAREALRNAIEIGPGRAAALDLLAADALVTLALQAQAEIDPAGLIEFAREIRRLPGSLQW